MPMDLVAKIKFLDNATAPLRKIEKQTERVEKAINAFKTATEKMDKAQTSAAKAMTRTDKALARVKTATQKAGSAMNQFGKNASNAMNRAARGTGGLARSIGAVATAYLGAKAAKSAWDRTIGAAAEYEMREVTVRAMFGGNFTKNAQKYLDFVEGRAAVSQFSMDDFLTAGKSFIPTTKDNAKLAKMVNLAERLGAIDPEQGLTGAAYALKEFFSGDALSLIERFELPRSVMNDLKNLPLDKQLKELDKYLDKIGATNELIEAQASTGLGEWRKSTAKMTKALREMGTEGLERLKPLLRDFNKWLESPTFQKFKEAGVRAFADVFDGAVRMTRKVAEYLDSNFISNPEFQRLTTLEAKVKYIFGTLQKDFNTWWQAGGKQNVEDIAKDLTNSLGNALKASQPILDAATGIGKAIGGSILKGMADSLTLSQANNPLDRWLAGFWNDFAGYDIWGKNKGVVYDKSGNPVSYDEYYKYSPSKESDQKWIDKTLNPLGGTSYYKQPFKPSVNGHAGGLDRVPYNGYPARLHRDEMVLTRPEAQAYRESQRDGGPANRGGNVIVTGNTFNVRNDSDIDKIASRLAVLIAG